jgi:Phage derived protein Gp49-like (DUF891)
MLPLAEVAAYRIGEGQGRGLLRCEISAEPSAAFRASRPLPHTVKHLEGKLWELRITGRDGISRAIYATTAGRRAVVLRVFIKKTQKTPKRELDLATERAKEVK